MNEPLHHPGLEGIVAGDTSISTLTGGLSYRGYMVEDLAQHSNFEEVAYLILHGELPSAEQLSAFQQRLNEAAAVPKEITKALKSLPATTPMMDVMRTGASMLAHWDADVNDNSHDANLRKAERLLAQLPIIMAVRQRQLESKPAVAPDSKLSLAGNILRMLRGRKPTQRHVRALDMSLIMYAEHEFNASTFTARVLCSTLSDLHSAITAAIGALKGPLHGGANARVMEVLAEVGSAERAEGWVREALANKRRIMGFGHRVYREGDPRAKFLKPVCAKLAKETGNEELEHTADVIERVVAAEKQLLPNVDWPSARLFHYLGLPIPLYTPLFVVSRVSGWSAHVMEQLDHNRLIRPRANYIGPAPRQWLPIEQRGTA